MVGSNALSFYMFRNVLGWSKSFVPDQKSIYVLCQTKRRFAFSKIGFCAGTKVFEEALNAVKFLEWLKKCLTLLQPRWIYSLKSVSDLNWKNIAESKTENNL